MISAKEAKVLATDITNGRNAEQLEQISKAIEKAARNGELKCYFGATLYAPVKNKLENLGYRVCSTFDRNETNVTIHWD